ncbi:fimbrial protein StdA [Salmonella enterica]|nr:fimbrial protein StdA [Salmonella enterica]EDW2060357.1 fimbrial protein [Salmonella enterica subsp. enterica serovar Oslo]EBR4568991.1 fimbrial protein StdA [Salmonella enterica]EBR5146375.1 fimbrial protein StdA [Salmonella enterica]EDY5958634.1 fimbrial protein [Salmonella enterica]
MRNSKLILAAATASMMYGASVYAETPSAGPFGSGQITFTGTITNSPCDIATGSEAINVPLGQVSDRHFKADSDTSDSKPFQISLRNCSFDLETPSDAKSKLLLSKVAVSFASTSSYDTAKHAVVNPVGAKNIGVQLLESDNSTVIDFTKPDTLGKQLVPGNNDLSFYARLIALSPGVTPGDVNVSVTYKLKYL